MSGKMSRKSFWQKAEPICSVIIGNMLYALTVKLFLLPAGLVVGGTTGLGLIFEHLLQMPVSGFVLAFNVVMLILGFAVLGKAFAATTVASTFLYPLFLELFNRLLGDCVLTEDIILCTLFSGFGIGIALGMVIRSGASTGGMDIPPLILQKTLRIPVSVGLYAFDILIIIMQAAFRPAANILYGILLTIVYTIVLDKMLMLGTTRTEVKIVSKKTEEICNVILNQIDRGVTLLEGEGGYTAEKRQLILSVISNRELPKLEKLIYQIDPESFIVVSRVSEVRGRGFSLEKKYS